MNKVEEKKIFRILQTAQGHPLDICRTLYQECLSVTENPAEVLQQMGQSLDGIVAEEDVSPIGITEGKISRFEQDYYKSLHEIISLLARKNLKTEEFYQKLYDCLFVSGLFPDGEDDKIMILYLLMKKIPYIPYYQAEDLLIMDNQNYRNAVERLKPQYCKAIHMLIRDFRSRTEEASQLCKIAATISNQDDQIVYWSLVLAVYMKLAMNKNEDVEPVKE